MTPEDAAAAIAGAVHDVGGQFMLARPTLKKGPSLGLPKGWAFYFAGRGGVLGDVDADVVAAAMVFFNPDVLRAQWDAAREVMDPADAALAYAEACQDWGREHLAGVDRLDRLNELLTLVIRETSPAGAPLFAGWRALPLPDDAEGTAAQLLQVMREYRGAMHAMAVLTTGLEPLEATIASGGADEAHFFNWPEPFPEREPLLEAHAEAEELTDEMAAAQLEVLDEGELDELVELLQAVNDHVFKVVI